MGGCPILNTFEKNYCEGHRHTPHTLGDPSEVVSELLFFDNQAANGHERPPPDSICAQAHILGYTLSRRILA